MKEILMQVAAFISIWGATYVGRADNNVKLGSKQWLAQVILIAMGALLIKFS